MIDFSAGINFDPEETASKEITPLDAAKNQLMQFRAAVNAMQREVTELAVSDAASEARASEMRAQIKSFLKRIKAQKEALFSVQHIAEAIAYINGVEAFTDSFKKDFSVIDKQIVSKISNYVQLKELERRKAEAAAIKAIEAAQKKIDREAKKAGVEPVQLPAPIIPQRSESIRTESGTTYTITKWDFEVIDIGKVPDKYIERIIRGSDVRDAIRAGVREIEGLKIYEKITVGTRTN